MIHRTRNTVTVLVAVALTAILLDVRGGAVPEALRSGVAWVASPFQNAAGALASPLTDWVQGVSDFGDESTRARLWSAQQPPSVEPRAQARLAELDALLGAVVGSDLQVVPARVVAYPAAGPGVGSVVVDVGSEQGVTPDRAVITGGGLVGRVTAVTARSSSVQLLSSPTSTVGARVARTNQVAVVAGTGDPRGLTLRLLDPAADIKLGDEIVSFGSAEGRPFPADLPIGRVSALRGDIASGRLGGVEPSAGLTSLDLVGVVKAGGAGGQRSVLPTEPSTQPSPSETS